MGLFKLWLKHRIATSPLAGPAERLRRAAQRLRLFRHPELGPRLAEAAAIDRALDRLIREADQCFDVGAHVGSVAHGLRRRAPGGRLTLVEPVPAKARWLARRFPDCAVVSAAASDREGEATFHENLSDSGRSSMSPAAGAVARTVRTVRLDDLAEGRVDFLKLDVEGHELEALTGAAGIIARDRPVILFEAGPPAPGGETRERALFDLLRGHGYEILAPVDIIHRRPALSAEGFRLYRMYPPMARNFFAIPPERMDDIIS